MQHTTIIDITESLETVHGGNKAKAVWNGAKTAWNVARPYIKSGAEWAETAGKWAAGGWAAKETWDRLRGNNQPQTQPAQ